VTFAEARARFPVLRRLAYLNAGSAGPLSRNVADAVAEGERRELEGGRGGMPYFEAMLAARDRLRATVAEAIGAPADRIALANSTTEGCNVVVAGLDLHPDDEVVTTDVEHFGLLGPLHASGARVRVARVRERPAAQALEAILAEVGPRTRLVAVSHVAWSTGNVLPVRELKASVDAPVLVDGAQSVGAIPVHASAFDFYTVSGQKWLCGPSPTGALYVQEPERLRVARPSYFGQDGYEDNGSFTPREGAARFDPGWISLGYLLGLAAALGEAPKWRFDHAARLAAFSRERLAERFEVITEPGQATLVSFRVPGDAAEAVRRAYEAGVVVRDVPKLGWVRVSCGYWTSEEDVERLVASIAA
jgi:L-cysteine/cystine lyase